MRGTYTFSLIGEATDPQALLAAAIEAANRDGLSDADAREMLTEDGEPNITECLVMLLDPSTIPGFEVHHSSAEAHPAWSDR